MPHRRLLIVTSNRQQNNLVMPISGSENGSELLDGSIPSAGVL